MQLRVIRHGVVESTNELALTALANATAEHGDVHVARAQTRGRGRRGAEWFSPDGAGLYLSLVWMPSPEPCETAGLSMAAGLGVHDALVDLGVPGLVLKWPNDLLAGDAKLCGILIESRGLDLRAPRFVIGIGLNVGPLEAPAALLAERPVTSLTQLGLETDVEQVLERVLPTLKRRLLQLEGDAESVSRDYLAAAGLLGREVLIDGPEPLRGRVQGIDLSEGLLRVECEGALLTVRLGHVRGLRPA